jgi:hypothetical protein
MIRLNKTLLLTAFGVQVLRPHECLRTCLRSRCAPSRAFGVSSAATLGLPSAYFYYIRSVRDNIPALPMHCSTDRRCGAGHLRLAGSAEYISDSHGFEFKEDGFSLLPTARLPSVYGSRPPFLLQSACSV